MDIDITSIIIAVAGLSTFFVPIAFDKYKKKNQANKHVSELMKDAELQNIRITDYDVWHETNIIAIDKTSGFLVYRNEFQGKPETVTLDLSRVQRCRMFKSDRSVIMQGKTVMVTDKVGILLTLTDQKKPEKKLVFYHADKGPALSVEIPLAEKWASLINTSIESEN